MGKEKHQVCVTEEDEDQLLTVPALMYRRFAYSASLRLKWVLQLKSLKIKKWDQKKLQDAALHIQN